MCDKQNIKNRRIEKYGNNGQKSSKTKVAKQNLRGKRKLDSGRVNA